jgi:hypothetical protein
MGWRGSSTSELRILSRRGHQNTRRTLISLEENIRGIRPVVAAALGFMISDEAFVA